MKLFLFLTILLSMTFASNVLPFDKTKIKGYTHNLDLDYVIAPIVNQIYIASKRLSKSELENIVNDKHLFKVISYNKVYGLLIQIDENNKNQLTIIEQLKNTKHIDNVYNRVYVGSKAYSPNIKK